jgi:RNA polymerase sigma-70 factor (ECF subfamily)
MDNAAAQRAEREQRLERWIALYGDAILRTCFVYLSDSAQAQDATQDAFLKAWHCMDQFEGRNGCSEKTWLMRIAINVCHDYQRSKWFRHVDTSKALGELPAHMDAVLPEDRALLCDILALPERYKRIVLLYYYQDMTLEEVAAALDMSLSTVHHRLQRAHALLKQTLTGGEVNESSASAASH